MEGGIIKLEVRLNMEDINNRIADIVLDQDGELIYDNTAKPMKAKIYCHFVYDGKIYVLTKEMDGLFFCFKQLEDGKIQLKRVDYELDSKLNSYIEEKKMAEFRHSNLYSKLVSSFGRKSKTLRSIDNYFSYNVPMNENYKDLVLRIYKNPYYGESLQTVKRANIDSENLSRWIRIDLYEKFVNIITEDVENNPNEYNIESKEPNQEEQAENNDPHYYCNCNSHNIYFSASSITER